MAFDADSVQSRQFGCSRSDVEDLVVPAMAGLDCECLNGGGIKAYPVSCVFSSSLLPSESRANTMASCFDLQLTKCQSSMLPLSTYTLQSWPPERGDPLP